MKNIINTILLFIVCLMLSSCCTISSIVGSKTSLEGEVLDQNNQPVPYCPLIASWEHPGIPIIGGWEGHSKVIMSDENGKWEFSKNGVSRIFVGIGKDCRQNYFPGYTPYTTENKSASVGGSPYAPYYDVKAFNKIYVELNKEEATYEYTPSTDDYLSQQYHRLRNKFPLPYSK